MFVDASALCAVLLAEPDGPALHERIVTARHAMTSPVAIWETVRAIVRETDAEPVKAGEDVASYLSVTGVAVVPIGEAEGAAALDAFARFGKGRHPAQLNMGDCFAYACARTNRAALLFEGDDFARTDAKPA